MEKPKAVIIVNHTLGIAPLGVVFTDASVGEIGGRVWSFGDGEISPDKSPHHEYRTGDYNATLTVWNAAGSSSATVEIRAEQPDIPAPVGGETSMMDLVPAVRRLLRGPSDLKLHYTAIVEIVVDILRGYARDLSVSDSDDQRDEHEARLLYLDGDNYLMLVPGAPELEAKALFYNFFTEAMVETERHRWREVPIVPLNYYSERNLRETPIASVYAGLIVENGTKLKINLPRNLVESARWKVQTALPILQQITMTSPVQMRSDFLRMLKIEAAIKALPQIRDDSESFRTWKKDTLPQYVAELGEWRNRWAKYLENDNQPQFAPKIAANEYRKTGWTRTRHPVERWRS